MDQLRRRRRTKARSAGFTLVEVMIALSVLAAGLLTVAAAQLYAMRGGSSGRHTSDAASVAHSQLENFQRAAFEDLTATGGSWSTPPEVVDRVETSYSMQWRITDVDPNLKSVDVRVTWDEPQRPGRRVILSTQVHNDPLTGG
jgi:type IV pilus assembly protein PilV